MGSKRKKRAVGRVNQYSGYVFKIRVNPPLHTCRDRIFFFAFFGYIYVKISCIIEKNAQNNLADNGYTIPGIKTTVSSSPKIG
ncbi:MAG: hypothetical protein RLZZ338_3924 [Cyanobacteriota bacterium]|jgi:preprotein translocase subunit SecY